MTDCIGRLFQRQFQDDIGKANELGWARVDKHWWRKKLSKRQQGVTPSSISSSASWCCWHCRKGTGTSSCVTAWSTRLWLFAQLSKKPVGVTVSNEWDGLKITPKSSALTTTAVAAKLREFDASGQLKDPSILLREAGFLPGKWIARKKDKLQAKLVKFEGGNVIIECEGEQYMATISAFIENQWKLIDEPKPREALDHVAFASSNSPDMIVAATKGKIIEKLMELEKAAQGLLEQSPGVPEATQDRGGH